MWVAAEYERLWTLHYVGRRIGVLYNNDLSVVQVALAVG